MTRLVCPRCSGSVRSGLCIMCGTSTAEWDARYMPLIFASLTSPDTVNPPRERGQEQYRQRELVRTRRRK